MQKLFMTLILSMLAGLSLNAADFESGMTHIAGVEINARDDWKAKPAKWGVTKHKGNVERILIGHSGAQAGELLIVVKNMQDTDMASGLDDIRYNFVIDQKGNMCRCRKLAEAPAMLEGHNMGSCGLCFLGNYEETHVTDEIALNWGKALAAIADHLRFNKLVLGKNVVLMSDLDGKRYPHSPGKNFKAKMPMIIAKANEVILEMANR